MSGDQVVELVEAAVAGNAKWMPRQDMPLKLINLSFHDSVTPDHVERILEATEVKIKELIIWHIASLPLEEAAKVASGRVDKVTTCTACRTVPRYS